MLAQPGDNWMIHVAVEQCRPGDILVVGCSADNTDGMFGDLLATAPMARGVTGLAACRWRPRARHVQYARAAEESGPYLSR
jgi:4-hydroxy-4-methyl-2-oxoglutarate aldolase